MVKESLTRFVGKHKDMINNMLLFLAGETNKIIDWAPADFDVTKLLAELDKTDTIFLYGIIKKAYDVVRAHKRAYRIANMSRADYYRAAVHDIKKDILIMDRIMSNVDYMEQDIKTRIESESGSGG